MALKIETMVGMTTPKISLVLILLKKNGSNENKY